MIAAPLWLRSVGKAVGGFLRAIPWPVWAIAAILFVGWRYGAHRYDAGHEDGVASNKAVIEAANAQIRELSQKLADQNASIEDAKRKAKEAEDAAKVAEAVADATKKDADADASAWQKKLIEARKAPQCAVLSMPLCDEVSDY